MMEAGIIITNNHFWKKNFKTLGFELDEEDSRDKREDKIDCSRENGTSEEENERKENTHVVGALLNRYFKRRRGYNWYS